MTTPRKKETALSIVKALKETNAMLTVLLKGHAQAGCWRALRGAHACVSVKDEKLFEQTACLNCRSSRYLASRRSK